MTLNVLHYQHQGRAHWGVVRDGKITPVPGAFATTAEFIRGNTIGALKTLRGATLDEAAVEWLSPVTRNQQFVCQGANYRQHMIESGMNPDDKTFNMIFTKASSCIVAADSELVRPSHVRFLDYEIELGLVMKRDITGAVRRDERKSARVRRGRRDRQRLLGARHPDSADAVLQGQELSHVRARWGRICACSSLTRLRSCMALQLRLTVNGEVRQNDSTANLVYGPAETLTELSGVQDLFVGDLLATGTPSGCALSVPSPGKMRVAALLPETAKWKMFMNVQAGRTQYLKAGDVVEASIASADGSVDLGVQRNRVVDEVGSTRLPAQHRAAVR